MTHADVTNPWWTSFKTIPDLWNSCFTCWHHCHPPPSGLSWSLPPALSPPDLAVLHIKAVLFPIIYLQTGSVQMFFPPLRFLVFNASDPVLQSLAALICWPRERGDVKVKKSRTPASAHLPESPGLIRGAPGWKSAKLQEALKIGSRSDHAVRGRTAGWRVMQNSYKHEKWSHIVLPGRRI